MLTNEDRSFLRASVNAGSMNQRVTLQAKSVLRNAIGDEVVTWVNETTFWAKVTPLRGREFIAASQIQGSADVRFFCRYRPDITAGKRLVWLGQPYDVRNVADIEGARVALEIMGASEVGDAR